MEEEMEAVREMVMREEREVKAEDLDNATVLRFLRARDMDVRKASAMLVKWWRWRRSFVPRGFVSEEEIAADLAHNKMFMQGVDKTGRPIVVVLGGRHKQGNLQDFKRFVVYTLDKICASGHEKFISIADVEGWGYSNSDIRGYLGALSILQDCYPERLGKLFMVHVPPVFMAAWKMVYPFVDANTKKKIIFVENAKLTSTLLQHIHPSQLPDIYGGQLSLVPIHNS